MILRTKSPILANNFIDQVPVWICVHLTDAIERSPLASVGSKHVP